MKIAAWNVAHQIRRRPFPSEIVSAFLALGPDVVVWTEYVPGPDHRRVLADLEVSGFASAHISARAECQNQVLVATRAFSRPGAWEAPPLRPQIPSNVLHVDIPGDELQVVGLRVPMFVSGDSAGEHEYRDWLRAQASRWGEQRTVVIGDLNVGPHRAPSWQYRSLMSFETDGWSVVTPDEGWSYKSRRGTTVRIDHAILAPGLRARDARYVAESGGLRLAGKHPPAYSDHAVLLVEVERA